jgi:very-short-patch-repair endonuclease
MFKPADPNAMDRARRLRRDATDPEKRLWSRLKQLNRHGFHFRRQAPFDPYTLDFVEHSAKLVIELDGGQHGSEEHRARDAVRDAFLESQGYLTLRFWNSALHGNIDEIVDVIVRHSQSRRQKLAESHKR